MSRSSSELKRRARANLTGHYRIPMEVFLLVVAIPMVLELPFSMLRSEYSTTLQTVIYYLAEFLISLVTTVLTAGQIRIHIFMARKKDYTTGYVFWGINHHPDRIILVGLLIAGLSFLASIPMLYGTYLMNQVLGGQGLFSIDLNSLEPVLMKFALLALLTLLIQVIIDLFLQLPFYLLMDYDQMTAGECIKIGVDLMKGQKKRLFLLMLSFIGMDLLMFLSLGIGSLWVVPYKQQTYALFYLDVIGDLKDELPPQPDDYQPFQQYV